MVSAGRGSVVKNPKVIHPKRGELYLTRFDPSEGAEIQKTRPALIIQNNIDNKYSPITIVAAITSRFDGQLYPTEVLIRAPEGGLAVDSVALLNQIGSIDKNRLIRRVGALGPHAMGQVDRAIQLTLGLVEV